MTYQPVVPYGGTAGWAFLNRTREVQEAVFNKSGIITRDTEYFEKNIGKIMSAEELVSDRRLLRVALGAFGLDADIDSKFFIKKVLEEGSDKGSLAARLSDKRYKAMADAFSLSSPFPRTKLSYFGKEITDAYRQRQFEVAVGETDTSMRLALSLQRDLKEVAESKESENTKWFTIMAQPALREVFETAFRLPKAVGTLDVDRQLGIFKAKAEAVFGSSDPAQFAEPERMEALTKRFFLQSELGDGSSSMSAGSIALSLLQSGPRWG